MPYDPNSETKVKLDNGMVLTFPPGMPLEQIKTAVRRANQLPPGPTVGARTGPRASTEGYDIEQSAKLGNERYPKVEDPTAQGVLGAAITGLSTGLSFVPGGGRWPTLARVLAAPVAHTAGTTIEGKGSPLTDFTQQMLLSATGEGGARALPYLTTPLSLGMGGAVNLKGGFRDTVRAFNREEGRRFAEMRPSILAGRAEEGNKLTEAIAPSSRGAIKQENINLMKAENASPHTLGGRDLFIGNERHASRLPISEREARVGFNAATQEQQAKQHVLDSIVKSIYPHATEEEILSHIDDFWQHGPPMPPGLNPKGLQQAFRDWLIDKTVLSTRQVGELQRSMSRTAKPAMNAAREGQPSYMAPDAAERENDLINKLRSWRHGPADQNAPQSRWDQFKGSQPQPGETGAINASDKRNSDLRLINDANEAMAGRGAIATGGVLATRGSLGYGLGRLAGLDPATGTALGLTLLSPPVLSGLGFTTARALGLAPGLVRSHELATKYEDVGRPKGTKRRDPQGR